MIRTAAATAIATIGLGLVAGAALAAAPETSENDALHVVGLAEAPTTTTTELAAPPTTAPAAPTTTPTTAAPAPAPAPATPPITGEVDVPVEQPAPPTTAPAPDPHPDEPLPRALDPEGEQITPDGTTDDGRACDALRPRYAVLQEAGGEPFVITASECALLQHGVAPEDILAERPTLP